MTISHLVFALATTGYILIAIQLEERDLVAHFGNTYTDYKQRVPMLVPFTRKQNLDAAYLRRQRG
jgi:protein-S-isoprenylcysteine O-methyltransferase Ste14